MSKKYEVVRQFDNNGPIIIEQIIDFIISLYKETNKMEETLR